MQFPQRLAKILAWIATPPLAIWAWCQERRILTEGVKLAVQDLEFARDLGISEADEVRVLLVKRVPLPAPEWLMRFLRWMGLPVFSPAGMALGQGIFLLPGQEFSLRHELVHVMQYQRLGGLDGFLRRYVFECLTEGYAFSSLEIEARESSGG